MDFKHNKKYVADNTLIINNLQYFDKIPTGKYNICSDLFKLWNKNL